MLTDLTTLKQSAEDIYKIQVAQIEKSKKQQQLTLHLSLVAQKEKIKHNLQSIVNKKSYNESNIIQI